MKPTYTQGQVRAQVNRILRRRGKSTVAELPKGFHSASRCPLAIALGADSVTTICARYGEDELVEFPRWGVLATFVHEFDCGRYPELDIYASSRR